LSNSVNKRDGFLDLDLAATVAIPDYYDTDLENFWTNIGLKLLYNNLFV
jgi:hypothetical protein